LSAPTRKAGPARLAELDGLRAMAILLVVTFHSWYFLQFALTSKQAFLDYSDSLPWFMGFVRRGDVGVDIFFVLSGYLLSRQLFGERQIKGSIRIGRFYLHRFFRIYPLYVAALALISLGGGFTMRMLGNLLAYNVWSNPFDIVIPWSWSLSVELEFYAIIPLIILLIRGGRSALGAPICFSAITIIWVLWVISTYPQLVTNSLIDFEIGENKIDLVRYFQLIYVAMPVRLTQFMFGVSAAWLAIYRTDILVSLTRKWRLILIGVALIGATIPLAYNPYTQLAPSDRPFLLFDLLFGRIGFALSIAVTILLLGFGHLGGLKKRLSSRLLEPVARFSFSMYLFHPVFVYLGILIFVGSKQVATVSFGQNIGVLIVAISGSMALGFVTWHLIEHPAIRFGRRLGKKLRD
jgi:peptidoglycan/LPS O-acetylase OafA/YrhL